MNDPLAVSQLHFLPQWTFDAKRGAITREFDLPDFKLAFAFMTQVAQAAEKHNHHPEWHNIYNKLVITWTTHDAGGITEKDIQMARICDEFLQESSK